MSDIRNDLIDTVDRLAAEFGTRDLRSDAERGVWPDALWRAMEGLGLPRALLPESAGGAGLEFADAMAVLRRAAGHALPVPLAETMSAGRLLSAAGLEVPHGPLTIAAAQRADRLDGTRGRHGVLVSGLAYRVPWGGDCGHVVAVVGGDALVLLAHGEATRVERNLAREPRVTLRFDARACVASAQLAAAGERLFLEGALARAVQMIGALERVLAYSVNYANERVQFGRPIGKFQAIQHMLAVLAGHVAAASAVTEAAIEASVDAPDAFLVAAAKARVGEAAGRGAEIAHQVHGAMGFTQEHSLHYLTRRLWAWREEFGNESHWQQRLGREVIALGADALWPCIAGK